MKKNFLINILLLVVLNILIKPLWVFIEVEVQNRTGVNSFGLYFALFNLSMVFNMVLDAGVVSFNNRKIARAPHLIDKYFNRLFPLRLLLIGIYLLVILFVALLLNYSADALKMLFFLALNQCLMATLMFLRSNLQGLHFFKSDSIVSVVDRVIMTVLALYAFYALGTKHLQIEYFVYIQTAGYGVAVLLAFLFFFKHSKIIFRPKFNFRFSVVYLKKCSPYALIGVLMLLYFFTDSVILERMTGEKESGIYAQSARLVLALVNFSYLFSVSLLPMFSKMLSKNENYQELIQLSGSLLILSSIFIAVSCAVYSQEIISFLYGKKEGMGFLQRLYLSFNSHADAFENTDEIVFSAKVFSICIFSFIPMSAMYIYSTFLTAAGEIKILNWSSGLGVVLNIGANILLIPYYGVIAVAAISLLTQLFVCVAQVLYARKKYKLQLSAGLKLRYFACLSVFATSFYFIQLSSLNWLLQMGLVCMVGMTASVLLKAIPVFNLSKFFLKKTKEH